MAWATYNFFPERFGGTEVYAAAAARALGRMGHSVSFIAGTMEPVRSGSGRFETREATHDGMPVTFLALRSERFRWEEMLGLEAEDLTAHWRAWLRSRRIDLLHLHGHSPACSVSLVVAAKQEGLPVAVSFHHPGLVCARGDFVHPWKRPCAGRARIGRCSACFGLTKWQALRRRPGAEGSAGPEAVAEPVRGAWHKLRTAGSLPWQFRLKQRGWRRIVAHVDGWHAFSEETRRILLVNGVPAGRIALIPHGVEHRPAAIRETSPVVRVGYVGRFHPEKGAPLLCQAIRRIPPGLPLRFLFHGRAQDGREGAVQAAVAALCRQDPRASFAGAFEPAQAAQVFAGIDVLVIPSLAFETGPLVALEAFQAGVPVVGPRWGSIPSLVRDGVNGLLFRWSDARDLAACLERIATEEGLLDRLRAGVRPPPSIEEHARALVGFYERIGGKAGPTGPA